MASMKKPSTSNRVKPVSSAAKVRMADTKATKAANAKAPRYPQGLQGYGMDTSKGSVQVRNFGAVKGASKQRGPSQTVSSIGETKKIANDLAKTVKKSKAAGITGKKDKNDSYTRKDLIGMTNAGGRWISKPIAGGPGVVNKFDVYRSSSTKKKK